MVKHPYKRTVLLLFSICGLAGLYMLADAAVTRISPRDMTLTAMTETEVRIQIYLQQAQSLPDTLNKLPVREGYSNRTTDGWGHLLIYTHEGDQFTLTSLGKDGLAGGDGDDIDITRQYQLIGGEVEEI